jgi:hypothetical protein
MIPPTMTKETMVPTAPDIKSLRRPMRSMRSSAGIVEIVLTIPYTPVASREDVLPSRPSDEKIVGA